MNRGTELPQLYMATHIGGLKENPHHAKIVEAGAALRANHYYDLRDDSGDNISEKNPYYSELTVLYWMWKNERSEFLGLCHYRRLLKIRPRKAMRLLDNGNDIVLLKKCKLRNSIEQNYCQAHIEKDWAILKQVLQSDYPEYYATSLAVFNQKWFHATNLFYSSRKWLEDYCQWLFPLCEKIEPLIDMDDGRNEYQKRVFGFMSERLFTLYIQHHQFKTHEVGFRFINIRNPIERWKYNCPMIIKVGVRKVFPKRK